jgi:hypothetical protein
VFGKILSISVAGLLTSINFKKDKCWQNKKVKF